MLHQPLNILQTCFSRSWGGLEIQALDVSRKLHERGHRVWLAAPPDSTLARESGAAGLQVIPLDVSGYLHPVVMWRIRSLLHSNSIDIIHSQLSKDLATVVPAMRISGHRVPVILSKRVGSGITKKDWFHRYTYSHVSRVLAISESIRRNVLDTTPATPDRVVTLHDAVDIRQFSPKRVEAKRVRREFGFTDETVVVGFLGRFTPGKGHEELLEAAAMLAPRLPNVHFLVVGEASYGQHRYEHKIRTMCVSMGLSNVVTFAGFRKDVPEVLAAFDILAFPSHAESFGVVLLEAMAMELPVVSTNCDGVLDIVVDGETGIYVNPHASKELAAALARLIENPALRIQMGKAGRGRVSRLFDQEKQIDRLEGMYYDLLGFEKGVPPSAG